MAEDSNPFAPKKSQSAWTRPWPLLLLAVVRAAKIPITATSANLSGAAECTTAEQVQQQLQGRISLIVDGGQSPRTVSSTIVHFKNDGTWQILRDGAIPAKDIVEALS